MTHALLRGTRLILLLALIGGPSVSLAGRGPSAVVEDALAYAASDRARAADLLEAATIDASPRAIGEITLHLGEQRRLLGEATAARQAFNDVLSLPKNRANHPAARVGIALIDAATNVDDATLAVLRATEDTQALPTQNADRYLVLAIVAAAAGDAEALAVAGDAARLYASEATDLTERISARLADLSATGAPGPLTLDARDLSDLALAERAFDQGDRARTSALLDALDPSTLSDDDQLVAHYLRLRQDASPVVADKIGVLLPLSGRYAGVGAQLQEALEYGFRRGAGRARLVVIDSGAEADEGVAALEQLVLQDGVVGVVGPLLSSQTEKVTAAAQALRVPLLGLSQNLEPAPEDDWIFRGAVSVPEQVAALVNFATTEADYHTFAIFAPDNDYGHTAADAFTASAEALGGQVTVSTFYDPESNDLTPFAKALGRKDYEARRAELRQLRREAEAQGGNPESVVLPPTLDFDALFVPDTANRVPLACAALAFEEFPVGEFRTSRDGDTIPLLGLNGWNKRDLLTQGGPYVRGSLFTEMFVADDDDSTAFSTHYHQDVGRTPSALEAVIADAGVLVAAATQAEVHDRATFRQALLAAVPEAPITGPNTLDAEHRTARHHIRILTITRDAIEVADHGPVDPAGRDHTSQP